MIPPLAAYKAIDLPSRGVTEESYAWHTASAKEEHSQRVRAHIKLLLRYDLSANLFQC